MSGGTIGLIAGIVLWFVFRPLISDAIGHEGGFNVVLIILAGLFGLVGGALGSLVESVLKGERKQEGEGRTATIEEIEDGRDAVYDALKKIGVNAQIPVGISGEDRPGPSIDVMGGPIEWVAVWQALEGGSYVVASRIVETQLVEPQGILISFDENDHNKMGLVHAGRAGLGKSIRTWSKGQSRRRTGSRRSMGYWKSSTQILKSTLDLLIGTCVSSVPAAKEKSPTLRLGSSQWRCDRLMSQTKEYGSPIRPLLNM
ncbi:MAG: hypothetical protein ACE5Q6_04070 [Dehalococcoidia bacterium]